jgi:protein phosphatase 1 regulatory subunit 7
VHSRIGNLDELRLPRFANHLKKLCLRQNHVSRLDPEVFHQLTKLEELDLYDNKIKDPGTALDNLKNLTFVSISRYCECANLCLPSVLDLSFNLLKAIPETLQHLSSLETVFFVQNKISKIAGLHSLASLRSLELGGNRIRVSSIIYTFFSDRLRPSSLAENRKS